MIVPALLGYNTGNVFHLNRVSVGLLAESEVIAQEHEREGDAEPDCQ